MRLELSSGIELDVLHDDGGPVVYGKVWDSTVSYSKLKSGEWGIRSTKEIKAGDKVTVTKKDGETRVETVKNIVWSGDGVWIAGVVKADKPAADDSDSVSGSDDYDGGDTDY